MALIELINDKKVRIFDKEESLLEVEKLLTRLLSEYDGNTEEMVQKLHQARDKQVLFDKSSICWPYGATCHANKAPLYSCPAYV